VLGFALASEAESLVLVTRLAPAGLHMAGVIEIEFGLLLA
jgi:hypothetical protein